MTRTAPSLIGGALSLAPLYPDLLKAEKNQRRDAEDAEERRGEEPFLSSFSASLCESLRLCVNAVIRKAGQRCPKPGTSQVIGRGLGGASQVHARYMRGTCVVHATSKPP